MKTSLGALSLSFPIICNVLCIWIGLSGSQKGHCWISYQVCLLLIKDQTRRPKLFRQTTIPTLMCCYKTGLYSKNGIQNYPFWFSIESMCIWNTQYLCLVWPETLPISKCKIRLNCFLGQISDS